MLRALALLPHEALNSLRQQALTGKDQSASIIAPGREGSQLGAGIASDSHRRSGTVGEHRSHQRGPALATHRGPAGDPRVTRPGHLTPSW